VLISRREFLKRTAGAASAALLVGSEGLMAQTADASINVDFSKTIGEIDPNIYGHFAEHLGGCVYGGIWADPSSRVPTIRGMRKDTLDLVRALRMPIVRWPGGCFSEHYHWEDGIGPPEKRPWRFDWVWKKPEPNAVGTHEFSDFCREVGTEPLVVVNVRTGTPDEAAAWVEYCNGPASSKQGSRRAANGHPQPFGVKYWGIGNEAWDLGAEESARRHVAFHDAMKAVDPSIALVAVGSAGWNEEWNRAMIRIAGEKMDYLAPHHYDGWGRPRDRRTPQHFYANVASAVRIQDTLRRSAQLLDEMLPHRPQVGVAVDEWGVWTYSDQGMQHDYDLSDGIVAASVFNAMHRLCRRARIACWAQLVNCLGMITTNADAAWPTPVYQVFELYRRRCVGQAVPVEVCCDTFDVDPALRPGLEKIPYLDASAVKDGKRCVIAVVNRHAEKDLTASLDPAGPPQNAGCEIETLNGPGMFSRNGPGHLEVTTSKSQLPSPPQRFTFPAHSVTILTISA
jgi:alpha-N-arabinofuranosidase